MSARHRAKLAVLAAAALGLTAAGCGGGDDDGGGGKPAAPPGGSSSRGAGGEKLSLSADPGGKLAFDKQSLRGRAGRVAIVMENPSSLSHNVSLEGPGVDQEGETVAQAGTSKVSATLKPGSYTFYCSVPGHREGGMEGKLTVR